MTPPPASKPAVPAVHEPGECHANERAASRGGLARARPPENLEAEDPDGGPGGTRSADDGGGGVGEEHRAE